MLYMFSGCLCSQDSFALLPDDPAMLALTEYGFECWEEGRLTTYLKQNNMAWQSQVPEVGNHNASRWIARAKHLTDSLGQNPKFANLAVDLAEHTELYWAHFPVHPRPLHEDARPNQRQVAKDFHKIFMVAEQVYGQLARAVKRGSGV